MALPLSFVPRHGVVRVVTPEVSKFHVDFVDLWSPTPYDLETVGDAWLELGSGNAPAVLDYEPSHARSSLGLMPTEPISIASWPPDRGACTLFIVSGRWTMLRVRRNA